MPFFLQVLVVFFASCIVSPLVLYAVKYVSNKYHILDRPHLYIAEQGRAPAPYGVGIMIFIVLCIFFPIIYWGFDFSDILRERLAILWGICCVLSAVHYIDDMDTIGRSPVSVSPIFRLCLQVCIGVVVGITSIKIAYVSNIFGGIIDLSEYFVVFDFFGNILTIYYIPICMTIAWYVLVLNSVNFSDGIPGLTGGFALISFVILAGLALRLYTTDTTIASQENSQFLLILLAVCIPATYVLTRADISRSAIMGDSGTIMLAFLIATFAIIGGGKVATAVSVLGIYLIDLVYVVTMRISEGKNPMKGDQVHHLHYRLLEIGLSKAEIRNIVYVLAGFFGTMAIFLDSKGKIALLVCIGFVTVFITRILAYVRRST